jgi:hypothetical protein
MTNETQPLGARETSGQAFLEAVDALAQAKPRPRARMLLEAPARDALFAFALEWIDEAAKRLDGVLRDLTEGPEPLGLILEDVEGDRFALTPIVDDGMRRVALRPIIGVPGDDGLQLWIRAPLTNLFPELASLLGPIIARLEATADASPALQTAIATLRSSRDRLARER